MGRFYQDTRRRFLKRLVKGGFTLLASLFGITAAGFLYPSELKKRTTKFFYLLNEDDLPKEGVKKMELAYEHEQRAMVLRVFVVCNAGETFALSSVCSHLGCLVDWSRSKKRFLCPCHGGSYDIEGRVLSGPPPLPLTRIPLKMEGEKVFAGVKV